MNPGKQHQTDRVVQNADSNRGSADIAPRDTRRTVIITGPPWPRSGTARVIQNQIAYYRSRGYFTVFVCVPVHCSFTNTHPDWNEIAHGIQELGADLTFFAPIDARVFRIAKYTAWVGHRFRGTALDWIVATGKSAQLPADALRLIRKCSVALVHVNHVFTLGFAQSLLRQLATGPDRPPLLLETHDVQSQLLLDRGEINPWTHRYDTLERLLQSEIAHLKKVNLLVHCSTDDRNLFEKLLPRQKHVLVLPTIDESFVSSVNTARSAESDSTDLLFVGQNTDFNCAAIKWFLEEVWPFIAHLRYRVRIVGAVDTRVREVWPALHQEFRSMFAGPVPELGPTYHGARCVFAPMVSGTGISIKTIEALALAKPFVGTSKAFRGMPMEVIEEAGLHAHDTPQEFADAISRTLADQQLAGSRSSAAFTRLFSNQASFTARDRSIEMAELH